MKSITQKKRYLQHEVTTKLYAVRLYRQVQDVQYVCRRYHVSKASLMRWNRRYDGTRESLAPKSHRPKTPHPNAHTEEELSWIRNLHRRNPNISVCEMYGKLREEKAYSRHPGSLYRVFVRLGYRRKAESTKKKSKHLGKYDTPAKLGVKWQMDVKYVPKICYVGRDGEVFFQYTMIEEASRKRFIYAYKEQSSFSTVDFVKRAITFFGYAPQIIQTDNGGEFCHTAKTKRRIVHRHVAVGIDHHRIRHVQIFRQRRGGGVGHGDVHRGVRLGVEHSLVHLPAAGQQAHARRQHQRQ